MIFTAITKSCECHSHLLLVLLYLTEVVESFMPHHASLAFHRSALELADGLRRRLIAQQDVGERQRQHHRPDSPAQHLAHSNPLQGTLSEWPDYFQVAVKADSAKQEDADVHGDVEEDRRVAAMEGTESPRADASITEHSQRNGQGHQHVRHHLLHTICKSRVNRTKVNKRMKQDITTFLRKTTKVELLGMLKKIHAAMEFRIRATRKRALYRQGKTRAVTLSSRTHLTEVLEMMLFILRTSGEDRERTEGGEAVHIQLDCNLFSICSDRLFRLCN